MFELTPEIIKVDIEVFKQRIYDAQEKLAELPATASTWQERKKLEDQRRVLKSEIDHVCRLIGYAKEALST